MNSCVLTVLLYYMIYLFLWLELHGAIRTLEQTVFRKTTFTCQCVWGLPEMEFLDINLTKDFSLLICMLFTVTSTGGFLKKNILFSGSKNPYKKSAKL